MTFHEYDTPDSNNHTFSYSVTDDGGLTIDEGHFNIFTIVSSTEDYLYVKDSDGEYSYYFFDEDKARTFRDSKNEVLEDEGATKISNLVSGHVNFIDENGNAQSVPSNAWVRIVPSRYQIEGIYTGVNCKIDSNGNFGSECYIHRSESEMRDAFDDSSETFQVVVYAETTGDTRWDKEEDSYGFIGNIVSKGAWHNFEIVLHNTGTDQEVDSSLTANISLSGNTLTVTFNKDMQEGYHTTGDYIPERSYWVDSRTFKIDFESYTPGGEIVLVRTGFETTEGKIMPNDVVFVFPEN